MVMKKRTIILVIVGVLLLLVVASAGAAAYLVNFALEPRNNHGRNVAGSYERLYKEYPAMHAWVDSMRKAGNLRDTTIKAWDGDRHHALYAFASHPTGKTAVLVHGYRDSSVGMLMLARMYASYGYNVLLPDLHAHGQSQGKDIRMGWLDRKDVEQWIGVARHVFAPGADTARIVVHGISMGAATTMCVSGDNTPAAVKCFVEDCGYTSAWQEFGYQLKQMFHLPEFPVLYIASWISSKRFGWNFKQASPLRQVARCTKPMLFIHGSNDTYVPTRMVYPLFHAKSGDKNMYMAAGSAHAESYHDHPTQYTRRVMGFVSQYIK